MATRKAPMKDKVITEPQAKNFKRMGLASQEYGISVPYFKKLFNTGKLRRYKLGTATMVDCAELEALIRLDVGNHGPESAPQGTK